jgi:hypothetical protein
MSRSTRINNLEQRTRSNTISSVSSRPGTVIRCEAMELP